MFEALNKCVLKTFKLLSAFGRVKEILIWKGF